jgi:chorismate mutase
MTMSEYQYYEFRAIDRPLTSDEMSAVGRLSSRVDLSPQYAKFVYNYSDLPTSAEKLLTKYFDAMFYIANWGGCQLIFRLPRQAVDLAEMRTYCQPMIIEEFLSISVQGDYVILNMQWHEEAPDWGWIEGENWLPRLLPLRDDLLRGDYRLLYLAWLKATDLEDMLDTVTEPPVPTGLRQLSPPLQTFIELFDLDPHLIATAAQASGAPVSISEAQLRRAIAQLSPETQAQWLLRLAQGEALLSTAFNQTLLKLIDLPQTSPSTPRTLGELWAAADEIGQAAVAKAVAEAKAKHLKQMETLAAREDQLWQEIITLIEQKNGRAYDLTVAHLRDLSELARHKNEEAQFQTRLNSIHRDYGRLSALIRRLRTAGLYEL